MKFLADLTLGGLAKWLRILGYDTVLVRQVLGLAELERALVDQRQPLTRKGSPGRGRWPDSVLVIAADRPLEQLAELTGTVPLVFDEERFFSRCLRCNAPLDPVGRNHVGGHVPEYIHAHAPGFRRCAACDRIYWPGSHRGSILALLKGRNPGRPP